MWKLSLVSKQCQRCGSAANTYQNALCFKCNELKVFRAVTDRMRDIDNHSAGEFSEFPKVFWEWIIVRAQETLDGEREPVRPYGMARTDEPVEEEVQDGVE
jgi:hypothetical protein